MIKLKAIKDRMRDENFIYFEIWLLRHLAASFQTTLKYMFETGKCAATTKNHYFRWKPSQKDKLKTPGVFRCQVSFHSVLEKFNSRLRWKCSSLVYSGTSLPRPKMFVLTLRSSCCSGSDRQGAEVSFRLWPTGTRVLFRLWPTGGVGVVPGLTDRGRGCCSGSDQQGVRVLFRLFPTGARVLFRIWPAEGATGQSQNHTLRRP